MRTTPLLLTVYLASLLLVVVGCANDPVSSGHKHTAVSETAPEDFSVLGDEPLKKGVPISFRHQVKPILESKCMPCHGGVDAGLLHPFVMTRASSALYIIPGQPDKSPFFTLTSTTGHPAMMPPAGSRLTPRESEILHQWITEGAAWPKGKPGELKVLEVY